MAVAWRQTMHKNARDEIESFIAQHPDFSLDDPQPPQVQRQIDGGGTNFVLWGHRGDAAIVYKFFHPDWGIPRYRNEKACLDHFAPTGVFPAVHAVVPETLIAMTRLPGRFINEEVLHLDENGRADLARQLGIVLGKMVDLPLPTEDDGYSIVRDFDVIPWNPDLRQAIAFYLDLCRQHQPQSPAGAAPFYDQTLALVENQLDRIADQRLIIWHEDLHCFADRRQLTGVFDVEMARLGTELIQLERAFRWCAPEGLEWRHVLGGYTAQTGRSVVDRDYVFMLAVGLFYFHIRIVRWGRTASDEGDEVAEYLPALRETARQYADYVDLAKYLPDL